MNEKTILINFSFSPSFCRLCKIITFIIFISASIELLLLIFLWWHDDTYYQVLKTASVRSFPELTDYRIPKRGLVYLGVFILVCLENIPYYAGVFILSRVLYDFSKGRVFSGKNIMRIHFIAYLMLAWAVVPIITETLRIFLFSAYGRLLFRIKFDFQDGTLNTIILGLICLIVSRLLSEIKEIF